MRYPRADAAVVQEPGDGGNPTSVVGGGCRQAQVEAIGAGKIGFAQAGPCLAINSIKALENIPLPPQTHPRISIGHIRGHAPVNRGIATIGCPCHRHDAISQVIG